MTTTPTSHRTFANPYSIRWRLPLTYAGIALLAVVALSGLLLLTLRNHYDERERQYIDSSATVVTPSAEWLYRDRDNLPDDVLQSAANIYSFLVQARVRLLDVDQQVIADSGPVSEQDQLSVGVRGWPFPEENVGPEPGSEEFETFLSIQGEKPKLDWAENGPADTEGARRYPIGLPREDMGRLLAGVVSGSEHTDLHVTVPLYDMDGGLLGYLELSESPAFGSEIIRDVAEKAVAAGIIAILLAAVAGWWVSRWLSQPVLSLADTTQRMAEGNLSARVTLDRRDEFGLLARTFNVMAERVENTVTTLKCFVANAAHEINTPITALRTNLELAAVGKNPDDFQADIAHALAELERLETLTQGLLTLSRLEAHDAERVSMPVDLIVIIRQMHERYASRAEQAEIPLVINVPPGSVTIQGDEKQIMHALDNLLDNALKFTPSGGTVTLNLEHTPNDIRLSVTDTGIGIPEEDLPKLFSRFHRGRNTSAYPGNGLGLVITKAIVEDHGGRIAVDGNGGEGTRFTIHLPSDDHERYES
jgi:signal transduction histidine kinase